MNRAETAGASDGSLAAYAAERGAVRDYSDDFIRRAELSESDRTAYKSAWYKAHKSTLTWLRGGSTVGWLAGGAS